MNTQDNPGPKSEEPMRSPLSVKAVVRPLYWSIRREVWENRSIYIAPIATSAVVLLGFLISTHSLARRIRDVANLAPALQPDALDKPYGIAGALIVVTAFIVGVFYCLDALHSERRDRSLLFWKSMPVSDLTTIAAKASIPLVFLPVLVFGLILATQLIMLAWSTLVLAGSGLSPAILWVQLPTLHNPVVLIYGLVVLALWHAPVYSWLILVSAWARRASFLWAVLPPLAVCVLEKVAFDSSHFGALLKQRLIGFCSVAFTSGPQHGLDPDPLGLVTSPGLWLGLCTAAGMLAASVWLRRRSEPL